MSHKKLLLIQLNEINFDLFSDSFLKFRDLKKIFDMEEIITYSETDYDLLEPWIQWVSVYSGKDAKDHKIIRLGDTSNNTQIFEILEQNGLKVGAVCPMNASNNLKKETFFLPDPWTRTGTDHNFLHKLIYQSISQAVNDNSQKKISIKSFMVLLIAFLKYASIKNFYLYFDLIFQSLMRKKKWCKALFLDLFLSDLFISNVKKYKINFASIFLNAGAHIQHHYFFNLLNTERKNPEWYIKAHYNPSDDLFRVYNQIFKNLRELEEYKFIISTGLSQVPAKEKKFYYRLKDHSNFLKKLNIRFDKVLPRMTRDFTIYFKNNEDLEDAFLKLDRIKFLDNNKLFGVLDKRNDSIFVTLTYPYEIKDDYQLNINDHLSINIFDEVVFVAIKNGIHNSKGYVFLDKEVATNKFKKKIHVKEIFNIIKDFFLTKKYIHEK